MSLTWTYTAWSTTRSQKLKQTQLNRCICGFICLANRFGSALNNEHELWGDFEFSIVLFDALGSCRQRVEICSVQVVDGLLWRWFDPTAAVQPYHQSKIHLLLPARHQALYRLLFLWRFSFQSTSGSSQLVRRCSRRSFQGTSVFWRHITSPLFGCRISADFNEL